MKKRWIDPKLSEIPFDRSTLKNAETMSDPELKIMLEKGGYKFSKKFQTKSDYVHRRIADNEVLISIGENIANFNGYIELNSSAAFLWDEMKEPRTSGELEKLLEEHFHLSHEKAAEDVIDFLNKLKEHDMVTMQ